MSTSSPSPRPKRPATGRKPRTPSAGEPERTDPPVEVPEVEPSGGTRIDVALDDGRVDPDALKVVRRLVRHGFEAYLVGGGVRDLLLGRRPKDFDIATKARPEQVRALFRNSRVIGRRFRLVHVLFSDRKVIEVATFRRNPHGLEDGLPGDDLLIRSDNAFGDAPEDAARRDLTINALFYDCDRKQVIDFVGGMPDIQNRVVRTIGDPEVRFREDPVRMIRAIKFAARLDLGMAPDVYDAIVLCRDTIASAARPRLLEEILKVLRSGASHRSIWLSWETGLLHLVLPELATLLDDEPGDNGPARRAWAMLREIDRRTMQNGPLNDVVLLTTLLLEPIGEAVTGTSDRVAAARDVVDPIIERLALPRRMADEICRIVAVLPRVAANRPGRLARTELFALASEVVAIANSARRS